MDNITVGRYSDPSAGWLGWIEPKDLSWIVFIDKTGKPHFYGNRDQKTGAII